MRISAIVTSAMALSTAALAFAAGEYGARPIANDRPPRHVATRALSRDPLTAALDTDLMTSETVRAKYCPIPRRGEPAKTHVAGSPSAGPIEDSLPISGQSVAPSSASPQCRGAAPPLQVPR